MKPLRSPRTLEEEAATTRSRADALHEAARDAIHTENTSWGVRRDAAAREAAAARHRAEQADQQADDLYAESNDYAERAGEADVDGSRIVAARPLEAEEHFERGKAFVSLAEATSQRAEGARELARQLDEKADALEQEFQRIEHEPMSPAYRGVQLEGAADQLDEKARLLGEAAQQQRGAAGTHDDPGASAGSMNWARYAQDQADLLTPDYSDLDPHVLHDAGVPRSEIPGSELMRPTDAVVGGEYDAPDSYGSDAYGSDSYGGDTYASDPYATDDDAPLDDMSMQ